MADKSTKPGDDEYHFSELETSDIYGSSSTQASPEQAARFKRIKRLIIVAATLMIIFVIYKISGVFFQKGKSSAASQAAILAMQQQSKPQALPTVPTVAPSSQLSATQQSVASLEQRSEMTQNAVGKLSTDVSDIKGSINQLQSNLSSLQTSIQNLTDQLQQQASLMQSQLELLKALQPPPKVEKKIVKKRSMRKTTYYIEAMIPGRAWLKSVNGNFTTVIVGDRIPGYEGEVVNINPHSGTVLMSNGATITYQVTDR